MTEMSFKVVVTGSINGQVEQFITKLTKIHTKTSISFALIAGDLFAEPNVATDQDIHGFQSLLDGSLAVPLPTYFTIGRHPLPGPISDRIEAGNDEICANLYFLGKHSITNTSEGIRIVSLGGVLDTRVAAGESKDQLLPYHTENDARTLRGANRTDILLTTHWPSDVLNGSKISRPEGFNAPRGEQCVADLCAALRPRYHFSTTDEVFLEREPFLHPPKELGSDVRLVTRFISLASIAAESKAKWLYAFSIDPKAPSGVSLPERTTSSPFEAPRKRPHPTTSHSTQPPVSTGMRNPKRRRRPQPPPGPSECFFCLANPNLSTHLLTSIGSQAYLSTARGPLLERTTYPELSIQSHILVIPLAHAATLSAIPDPAERTATFAEMERYRHSLQRMLSAKAANTLGAVTWELSRAQGIHAHWQFLPLSKRLIEGGLAEAAFRVQAENSEYPPLEVRDVGDGTGMGDYFRVWFWTPAIEEATDKPEANSLNEETKNNSEELRTRVEDPSSSLWGTEQQLVMSLDAAARFDVAFGRRVMANLLEMPERADWKDCKQSDADEEAEAEGFKAVYKEWDFSLE